MITRRIGGLLRGKATPGQILAACLMGSWIGFLPSIGQAPGLFLFLLGMLFISNANLGLAVGVWFPAKLLCLLLMPLSFSLGRFFLDGPTGGLFAAMINAPVLALFGFEYYVTPGGLALGTLFGLGVGFVVIRAVQAFRLRMANVEENSERYRQIISKFWVKALLFLFVGRGHGKKTFREIAERRSKNPVRILGLVVVLVLGFALWLLQGAITEPVLRTALADGLSEANGATVDVERVELDLSGGRLAIHGLAMADPNALSTDLFRTDLVEADVSGFDLLRKRLAIDSLVVRQAEHGAARAEPGVLVVSEEEAPPEDEPLPEERTLEDVLAEVETWKERLSQARRWLEDLSAGGEDEPEDDSVSWEEELERQVERLGWAKVTAAHLVEGAPTFLISELRVERLESSALPGDPIAIEGLNLSTHPDLVAAAPSLNLRSESGRFEVILGLGQASQGGDANRLKFLLEGISGDRIAESLAIGDTPLLSGGTVDVDLDGSWAAGRVGFLDLPLQVRLHDTTLHIPGSGPTHLESFAMPLGLRGRLDSPRITLDDEDLVDALVAAGKDKLASEARARAEGYLDEAKADLEEKLGDKLGDELDSVLDEKGKGLLDGLLGGDGR